MDASADSRICAAARLPQQIAADRARKFLGFDAVKSPGIRDSYDSSAVDWLTDWRETTYWYSMTSGNTARTTGTRKTTMTTTTIAKTPAASLAEIYLAGLSSGSRQGMRQALDVIAGILDDEHDADTYPWHEITYRDAMTVRMALAEQYQPATVNKMLSALRGVLKQTWRLGLIDADTYHRAAAVENVRVSNLLSGRALASEEIVRLFEACAADPTPKGARDAAILAVFYGCGLRRGELARLDVDDFDPDDCSILVQGKRRKQRTLYLTEGGYQRIEAWLRHRGDDLGPLFCPVRQSGEIPLTRMRGESIAYILRRRQEQAGIDPFSPHDLRRSTITHLLDAGVDVFTVQKLAGHADATTTARYDRRGESAKRRAVESLQFPQIAA